MSWALWLGSMVFTAASGAGAVKLIEAIARRHVTKATAEQIQTDAAERLTDAALKYVREIQEDAATARAELAEARREAADLRREMVEMSRQLTTARIEAAALTSDLRRIRSAILDPNASLRRLRTLVGDVGINGREEGS